MLIEHRFKFQLFIFFGLSIQTIGFSEGIVIDDTFYSKSLEMEKMVDVYLPEGYDSASITQQYPVVYFLHGGWGNQDDYSNIIHVLDSLIGEKIIDPVIVVKPDGSMEPYLGSSYVNSVLFGSVEDYITFDLIEYIDTNYNTDPRREKRSIMGHSMGGEGSMRIALKHPKLYAGVASHGGILDSKFSEFIFPRIISELDSTKVIKPENGLFSEILFSKAAAWSPNLEKPPHFVDLPIDSSGKILEEVWVKWRENSAIYLVDSYDKSTNLAIYLDCGTQDFIHPYNVSFSKHLDSLNITHTFKSYEGNHNNRLTSRFSIALTYLDSVMNFIPEHTIYFKSPAVNECILNMPSDYQPDKSYPMVINLHGGGSSYQAHSKIYKYVDAPGFIMATPQAPYKWLMDSEIGYDWSAWPTGDLEVMNTALDYSSEYIANLVESLKSNYHISELYLMGFSQGSIVTMFAGIHNYKSFDGLIILSGAPFKDPFCPPFMDCFEPEWPNDKAIRKAKRLKIFIAHGLNDPRIDIQLAHKSEGVFKAFGYDVTFFDFDGGHNITRNEMNQINDWLTH
ncbi:MAG: hypothetical protein HQ509_03600 [Candidatus Marinimicrobia bacterium]|nr:hypothetical protein [Candidatus Neomarinimicrobiota bacterium]